MKTLTIDQLFEVYNNLGKNELLLDVRTPEEYSAGHIPGSRNIPHDNILSHAGDLKKYDTAYLYCRSGGRVQMAAQALATAGVTNLKLVTSGGMPDWERNGYPVEK